VIRCIHSVEREITTWLGCYDRGGPRDSRADANFADQAACIGGNNASVIYQHIGPTIFSGRRDAASVEANLSINLKLLD